MATRTEPPVRAGISLGDALAATFACLGTLVALHHRERSGRGQVVDSAIYEAVLAMMESLLPEWAIAGYQRERTGAVLPNVAPSNVYPTGDGDLVLIAANQDTVFTRLAAVMERPDLAADTRFANFTIRHRCDRAAQACVANRGFCSLRLSVRTPPFHGGESGSIPLGSAKAQKSI